MALACFAVLWALRKRGHAAGWLFSVYMLLAGAERLLIEQIRINPVLDFGAIRATQAEMIAALLIVAGAAGTALLARWRGRTGRVLP
jgi:phosphatidylglycerol:prolipoprotein diacylglycerol transferase